MIRKSREATCLRRMPISTVDRFQGLLLGTAVGDALGLPTEGLSARRSERMFKPPLRHRFIFGYGMVSDDTEHAVFTAQSLIAHPCIVERFAGRLAWCLRLWLLSLPAGVGFATLLSIFRLWVGVSASQSGVRSAGNGAAMRAASIGAFLHRRPEDLEKFIKAACRLTHSDFRAEIGARAVANVAVLGMNSKKRPEASVFLDILRLAGSTEKDWKKIVGYIECALRDNVSVREFARSIGAKDGVSGYVYETVPVVVFAWFTHYDNFAATLQSVIECGGDTDTTGALVGALSGATVGASEIPKEWILGLAEYPRNVPFLMKLGRQLELASVSPELAHPVRYFWPAVLPRNVIFLVAVLVHGFRRLFPPY